MCFSGPSVSSTTPPPVATASDPVVTAGLNNERIREQMQSGRQSTILTQTPQLNTQSNPFQPKTLLGQ